MDRSVANARLAGLLARRAHGDGILLDTEQYEGQLFDYRKQRDAAKPDLAGVCSPGAAAGPGGHDGVSGDVSRT